MIPGRIEDMDFDYVKVTRDFVESDLKMTIMCGSLNTLEDRLRESIGRCMDMMEKAVRYELEQSYSLVQKRGKTDE
jgi:hypothetical protein